MLLLTEIDEIRYGILENEDLSEMAGLIGDVFSRFDPLGVAVGMTPYEISAFVLVFGQKAIIEGLAIIARDQAGWLVGAMFSDDLGTPPPDISSLPESFAPVGALLESLDEQYLGSQTVVAGSHVHLNMLAVLPALSGNGIAQNLVKVCIENAARCNYRIAITEANGPVSEHIFRKLGFQDQFIASYQDFLFEGRAIFSSIESTNGTILMEANISELPQ